MLDFNALRLAWGPAFLTDVTDAQAPVSGDQPGTKTYTVNVQLRPGWYMIELRMSGQKQHQRARLTLRTPLSSAVLGMAVSARQVSKRLVHLSGRGTITIDVDDLLPGDGIHTFRLARVTARFARSRIKTKLEALHPKYQDCHDGYATPAIPHRDLETDYAWRDYCALFEESGVRVRYRDWVFRFDSPSADTYRVLQDSLLHMAVRPVFTIAVEIAEAVVPHYWNAAIDSVLAQIYPDWRLVIVDRRIGADSTDLLSPKLRADKRIHVASDFNQVLAESGDWIVFLGQHDVLPLHALYVVADAINRHSQADLIYSDEDSLDADGARHSPGFKCDWNEDLMLSADLFGNLGIYRTEVFKSAGGWDGACGGAARYDLTLRCLRHTHPDRILHIPRVLYHNRAKPSALRDESVKAVTRHLSRTGAHATVTAEQHGHHIRYPVPENAPLVTLIIPTRNGLALLSQCVKSIIEKTRYPHFEIIIVDNGSDDPATIEYIEKVRAEHGVRVLRDDSPFNYSALNNRAVEMARGEFVALVNNDVEVIDGDWLDEIMGHALRPEVGIVGAKLLYSNGSVQHAGVIIGLSGCADHLYSGLPRDNPGYMARAVLTQTYSAVTGACLVVRRALYRELGGLNERDLAVSFNDVDFCLRVRAAGYKVLWTPHAVLYHHESATRGRDDTPAKVARAKREADYIRRQWQPLLDHDPAYSPNLSLMGFDCQLAWPPRVTPLVQLGRQAPAR